MDSFVDQFFQMESSHDLQLFLADSQFPMCEDFGLTSHVPESTQVNNGGHDDWSLPPLPSDFGSIGEFPGFEDSNCVSDAKNFIAEAEPSYVMECVTSTGHNAPCSIPTLSITQKGKEIEATCSRGQKGKLVQVTEISSDSSKEDEDGNMQCLGISINPEEEKRTKRKLAKRESARLYRQRKNAAYGRIDELIKRVDEQDRRFDKQDGLIDELKMQLIEFVSRPSLSAQNPPTRCPWCRTVHGDQPCPWNPYIYTRMTNSNGQAGSVQVNSNPLPIQNHQQFAPSMYATSASGFHVLNDGFPMAPMVPATSIQNMNNGSKSTGDGQPSNAPNFFSYCTTQFHRNMQGWMNSFTSAGQNSGSK